MKLYAKDAELHSKYAKFDSIFHFGEIVLQNYLTSNKT